MTDYSKLKRLADNAAEQRKNWEEAGKPWPIWNSCMYEMHSAVTPEVMLVLIAENEALRKDAERYRWLCDGNGYFMEEEMLCGHSNEKAQADLRIDQAMGKEG